MSKDDGKDKMDVISKEGHALLEELIRVGIDGKSRSFKKIPRRRMMQGNINKLFDVNVRLERSDCTVCCTAVAKPMDVRVCLVLVHRRYPPLPPHSPLTRTSLARPTTTTRPHIPTLHHRLSALISKTGTGTTSGRRTG